MPTPGPVELIIILVIALIILGPGRLPDVGSALGKSIREFRKASSDIQDSVKVDVSTSPLPPATAAAPTPVQAAPVETPTAPSSATVASTAEQSGGAPTNEPQTGTN